VRRQPNRGFTLLELVIALALSAIVMALVGSLFVASLSTWRRGQDMREAQAEAAGLVEVMARDIRNASQAPSVTIRPQLPVEKGDPILSITVAGAAAQDGGSTWIIYLLLPERQEVVRQTVAPGPEGRIVPRDSRLVARGVESVIVEPVGMGVVIEATVRRGREVARSRATAAPRNP